MVNTVMDFITGYDKEVGDENVSVSGSIAFYNQIGYNRRKERKGR